MVNPDRPDKPDPKRARRRQKPRTDRPDLDEASLELLTLLRKRREELGMTIYDLAKRAGISPSYVSLLENGRQVPNARLAMRIASALDLHEPLREAYQAWVDLRRHDTATGAFEAAHKLRGAWSTLEREYPHLADIGRGWFQEVGGSYGATLNAAGPPRMSRVRKHHAEREREGATEASVLRVPVVAEGRELRTPKVRVQEWLAVDEKMLPPGEEVIDPFAWRLSKHGTRRVGDLLRPGDYVVFTRVDVLDRAPLFRRDDLWLVRHLHELVLTRVVSKGRTLVLLPPLGSEEHTEIIDVPKQAQLLQILAGKVVTTIRSWGRD